VPIELKPETEALIRQDVQRDAHPRAADFIEHAVSLLHEREESLSANRSGIAARIEPGYASAQRGDTIDADEVRIQMAARKHKWLAQPDVSRYKFTPGAEGDLFEIYCRLPRTA